MNEYELSKLNKRHLVTDSHLKVNNCLFIIFYLFKTIYLLSIKS